MPHAIRVYEHGGPETLRWEEVEPATPADGEVRVRHTAVGLNYVDCYFRSGLYTPPQLPFTPGMEAAGIIEAVGPGVTDLREGDRIAYAASPPGSYAESRLIAASKVVKLPEEIADDTAAAMMLKGMTAQVLLRRVFRVEPGQTLLIHAAAGGVGSIVCQWARHLGATVIGTVGSRDKAEQVRTLGCQHPIVYSEENFVERVQAITKGRGVDVVYDSVGRDTFLSSLDCLRPMGMMVSFGQSSGPAAAIEPGVLSAKGSLYLTRPLLFNYTASRSDLLSTARELFQMVSDGVVKIEIGQRFPLSEAAAAHRALESRQTTGSSVLTL